MKQEYIKIKNARENNLKDVNIDIEKNKLVVITGVSGSGKTTLAFDTIYAEGQRRYVESLSSYARQFLGIMKKPDVESITGLSPAISIDQKNTSSNPRSTVGTITEIYGYLRLLFGHIGLPHCPKCGAPIQAQTIEEITKKVFSTFRETNSKIQIVSPLIKNRKGQYNSLFSKLLSKGFLRVIVDGDLYLLDDIDSLILDENKKHTIDLVIDRLDFSNSQSEDFRKRLTDAIELATNQSDGEVKILADNNQTYFFSENNTCYNCEISYPKIKPSSFSFNDPEGACETCSGLGYVQQINVEDIYNPKLTIREGGVFPIGSQTTKDSWTTNLLEAVAKAHNFSLSTPIGQYPQNIFNLFFYGTDAKSSYIMEYTNRFGITKNYSVKFNGIINELQERYRQTTSEFARMEIEKYMSEKECPTCNGKRLKPYALGVTIDGKNIEDISNLSIKEAKKFFMNLKLTGNQEKIARPIIKEIANRLNFLINVGLDYLTLSRKANSLSGGESQRIRLASQIGTGLSGVVYVLDEPSIGLHARDVDKLISSLKELRDANNSVIIVEHDTETMKNADWIIDMGPLAGKKGGEIVAQGTFDKIKNSDTLTGKYLSHKLVIGDKNSKKVDSKKSSNNIQHLSVHSAKTNNLKSVDIDIPLGKLTAVTGVSGSGKSSLINDTLVPYLMNHLMNAKQIEGSCDSITGLEYINKVINIDQSPIGKTPRSNPATYTGMFTNIRDLLASTNEAKARGYNSSRFSFNVKGGRCEKCKGEGQIKIEMQFLPDIYITCDQCNGTRYNSDALQIDYKGKNIAEILSMTVDEAASFFKNHYALKKKLDILKKVGLGYIELGQSALTLSGGESQRIKLAKELSKVSTGKTVYIMDEPTTGLHFYDVDNLLSIIKELVREGNTVIMVEHHLDMIKNADWIIDLGPEGGEKGGYVVAQGTVQDVINNEKSYTGQYLKKYLEELKCK